MACRVMLVDDSEADLLFTRIVLERAGQGFDVLSFEEARAALDYLRSDAPRVELILLDINMPGMNGFEFLDAYEALPAVQRNGSAIVMLSSSADPSDRERAAAYRCVAGYVTKPLDPAAAARLRRQVSA
ncbi:response regulator [Rubrivivax sp. JA1026]|uniref:response regulator n=1 Tax=Rubrivivax sp. JA1026 TaxID=2710888 RepID=UPI001F0D60CE|nr:response regulator [Rubrivivax sp. JA1026]